MVLLSEACDKQFNVQEGNDGFKDFNIISKYIFSICLHVTTDATSSISPSDVSKAQSLLVTEKKWLRCIQMVLM